MLGNAVLEALRRRVAWLGEGKRSFQSVRYQAGAWERVETPTIRSTVSIRQA